MLVTDAALLDADGNVHVQIGEMIEGAQPKVVQLPGHFAKRPRYYDSLPSTFVPAQTARANGWQVVASDQRLITYASDAAPAAVRAALEAARQGGLTGATIEQRHHSRIGLGLLAAALAAGFVTLVGVAISVALSAAEGRADLATLSAVGAPPRVRRLLAGSQAALIGGSGTVIGVLLGSFVAFALRSTFGAPGFEVPWQNLIGVGVAVPVVAALVAAAFTPSRLPLMRRLE